MPVGVVGFPAEAVCPYVRNATDVPRFDGDVVLFGEEEELSQL